MIVPAILDISISFLLSRYAHLVCSALLVGGTLFYETVVPGAIDDLKDEQKLSVFGRARWMFRGIVWVSAFLLFLSGILSTVRHWPAYNRAELDAALASGSLPAAVQNALARANDEASATQPSGDSTTQPADIQATVRPPARGNADADHGDDPNDPKLLRAALRPGWWWAAHASTGMLAILISLSLTIGRKPPDRPVQWMRLNLIVLLIVMFLASATREIRLARVDRPDTNGVVGLGW